MFLEGSFFTRLSSLLTPTPLVKNGLGLSSESLAALNAARNELVQRIGLDKEEGLSPEVCTCCILLYNIMLK